MRRGITSILGLFGAVALAACSQDSLPAPVTRTAAAPVDVGAIPASAPENVLMVHVAYSAPTADSVRVVYQAAGGVVRATPFRAPGTGSDTVPILGLTAATTYQYHVEALTDGVARSSQRGTFTTASLPAPLAGIQLRRISGKQSHYLATGINGYAVVFDTSGVIVWYHDFTSAGLGVSNVIQQANGNFTAFLGNTGGWQPLDGYYVEVTPDGREIRTYRPPSGHYMDDHELLLTGSGLAQKAVFFTFSTRTEDLSALGVSSPILTAGHQIVRQDASGNSEFTWDAWDHITFDEWVGDSLAKAQRNAGTGTDFDHPNAITFDDKGNYIVSWRNLDQITAIDPHTGTMLWRLGGEKSDFTFLNDPMGGFHKQHAVKVLANGNILLFDNGTEHTPPESRAVEYHLDFEAKTATMVWQYRHTPGLYAVYVGWVQRFANGNTWVAFSLLGRVVEVDAADNVLWEAELDADGTAFPVYRMVPVTSLYGYVPS